MLLCAFGLYRLTSTAERITYTARFGHFPAVGRTFDAMQTENHFELFNRKTHEIHSLSMFEQCMSTVLLHTMHNDATVSHKHIEPES